MGGKKEMAMNSNNDTFSRKIKGNHTEILGNYWVVGDSVSKKFNIKSSNSNAFRGARDKK
jgi:hypothetical protein